MQNAKDTFYTTLQSRLAALNPARQIVVRGVLRPGTLVDENELPSAWTPVDAFRLHWTTLEVTSASPLPWVAMECVIQYATDGSAGNGGMDRGRALAAMDAELAAALSNEPRTVPKMNYSSAAAGIAPKAMATNVFWADPLFGAQSAVGERLERSVMVQVFSYQEAGEL
ncbi:MAG TPA: hypothetical protein VGU46_10955 [Acidobacteriaceae bacterium]|nr:hypothetical protein [Acidobacteriaceae bacterium]